MPTPTATSETAAVPPMTQYEVKFNGTAITGAVQLVGFVVDTSLSLPAMAELVFLDNMDPSNTASTADELSRKIGNKVEIRAAAGQEPASLLFKGEVAAIETRADSKEITTVLRCVDNLRKLYGGRKVRTMLNMKHSAVVSKVVQEAGLQSMVDATTVSHPFVIQHNESDGEFLERLAAECGYLLYCDKESEKIVFKKPPELQESVAVPSASRAGPKQLMMGEDLIAYEVMAGAPLITKVETRGWDGKNKQAIVATKTVSDGKKFAKVGFTPPAPTRQSQTTVSPFSYFNQDHATSSAGAIADHISTSGIRFRGRILGNPNLSAGVEVAIGGAGEAFSGHYLVTSCRHTYDDGGLETEIVCDGLGERGAALAASGTSTLISPASPPPNTAPWAMTAIVTNLNDPDSLGRVKVKFPTLGQANGADVESDWVRVVSMGFGAERGFSWLPEVNDEVLFLAHYGDLRDGFIVGGLHNTEDKPPAELGTAAQQDGKVEKKGLVTRAKSRLLFNDKQGEEGVEVHVKDTVITMKFDAGKKVATITVDGNEILTMESGKGITIESKDGDVNIKGVNVKIEAKTAFEAKGTTAKVEGSGQTEVKGATVTVNGSGMTEVKGGLVKIN